MTRRGQKKHLKRLPAPKHWPIKRKAGRFTTKPIPGPHPKEDCLTLAVLLREIQGYAENMHEVKAILSSNQVTVDGRIRRNPKFPIGIMDVVKIETEDKRYRLLPKLRGGLRLVEIDEAESQFKLCRIEKKQMVSGGKLQLTLHDGRNIILSESQKPSDYNTLDVLKISIPEQQVMSTIPLKEGALALVTRGKNVGMLGTIVEINKRYGSHASTVTIQNPSGERIQTALEYVFMLGQKKSEVNLGEGGSSE
ncbi:MAG: 30S ribosomal protein S4e [Candidatus Thorarchaeota archaeon]